MNRFFNRILPFEKYEMKSELTKAEILKKAKGAIDCKYGYYYGFITKDGFVLADKPMKSSFGGVAHNSLVPVAVCRVKEKEGLSVISVTVRSSFLICLVFYPLYFFSLLVFLLAIVMLAVNVVMLIIGAEFDGGSLGGLIPFPIFQFLSFVGFKRHSKELREFLENTFYCENIRY